MNRNGGGFLGGAATCAVGVGYRAACVVMVLASTEAWATKGTGFEQVYRTVYSLEELFASEGPMVGKEGWLSMLVQDSGGGTIDLAKKLEQSGVAVEVVTAYMPYQYQQLGGGDLVFRMWGDDRTGETGEPHKKVAFPRMGQKAFADLKGTPFVAVQFGSAMGSPEENVYRMRDTPFSISDDGKTINFAQTGAGVELALLEKAYGEVMIENFHSLVSGEVDVEVQEVPGAGTTPEPEGFSKEVADCVEEANKSTKPMRECYNLYLGRDPDARWFEEVYQADAEDRHNYGPFVTSPLERVDRTWLE